MTSPFPGMDPYLEGYLWPDVHHRIASVIAELLAPQISPKYVARIELYNVSDTNPNEDIGIIYPDVEVLKRKDQLKEPAFAYSNKPPFTPPTVEIPINIAVKIPVVEIRDRDHNQLITAIEVLSPVNKRSPGFLPYLQKRQGLIEQGVHLLEIDLIRRGKRPFAGLYSEPSHYLIALTTSNSSTSSLWAINIQDTLPVVPVPLVDPDKDVALDVGKVIQIIYERGLYHLSIDYGGETPPPKLSEEEKEWVQKRVKF